MNQLTLVWEGPFDMKTETPKELYGKPGLYAILHDSKIVYIGKAQYGTAVLREAKNRENKWIKCFRKKGLVSEAILGSKPHEYVERHCQILVGIISGDQQLDLLGDAEKLLIFKIQPICNDKHKKQYKGAKPIMVINDGKRPKDLQAATSASA